MPFESLSNFSIVSVSRSVPHVTDGSVKTLRSPCNAQFSRQHGQNLTLCFVLLQEQGN